MKQLPMTPELAKLINDSVGPDVDASKLTVFETIALNNRPLPGKRGTIFENAVVMPVTLAQMVDSVNAGNHLPLIADHSLFGAPKGRFFHAGLNYENGEFEMRALFYLDETEQETIAKLNAGSLDEVSVSFLSTQFLCSECGFDYFSQGTPANFDTRTCGEGHTIGEDGVHADMVGLNQFIELSLVARGAADKPKIVGKSESKLAPETAYRLAANGFEPNALVLQASLGTKEDEEMTFDPTKLVADLTASISEAAVLKAEKATFAASLSAAETRATTAEASVATLTAERDAALAAKPEGYDATVAENAAALSYLGKQFDQLTTASGKPKVEGDARPKTVAEFTAKIDELTGGLTSILPVGGKSVAPGSEQSPAALSLNADAFRVRN